MVSKAAITKRSNNNEIKQDRTVFLPQESRGKQVVLSGFVTFIHMVIQASRLAECLYLHHVASMSEPKVATPIITTSCSRKEEKVEHNQFS